VTPLLGPCEPKRVSCGRSAKSQSGVVAAALHSAVFGDPIDYTITARAVRWYRLEEQA